MYTHVICVDDVLMHMCLYIKLGLKLVFFHHSQLLNHYKRGEYDAQQD